jgi:hypothetical protein
VGASALLVACGGGGSDGAAPGNQVNGTGTLRVALTDAPRCKVGNEDLDAVFVTVEQVRVHQSPDDDPTTGRWYDIDVRPAKKINLLDLTNGRLEELGTVPLPAGTYSQVRLVLGPNRGASTPANSVVEADNPMVELPLQTPSAAQSGLKIIRPFSVAANTTVDLVIDFDACRSIVLRGNGSYLLKPVLTADLKLVSSIVGYVDPTISGVTVSAQKNGRVVRSTVPATDGSFALAFLDSAYSPYDVVITAQGKATAAVSAVPATAAQTAISTADVKITMSDSPVAKADGMVGPTAALLAYPSVRALQAIGPMPVLEIGHVNVNPDTGKYELMLPSGAAKYAIYATPLPLSFTIQGTKSSYTLEASATGYVTQVTATPVDVPVTQDFTLVPVTP